jgi:hypothetical protein
MNANSISRPINQQSAQSWTPVLAAFLVAIALVIGVAGVAALTARTASTSPMAVPRTLVDHPGKDEIAPTTPAGAPMFVPRRLVDHPGKDLIAPTTRGVAPVFVPQSNNIHEQLRTQSLGVPYPGGVAGPSQVTQSLGVPYPGGVAGPSQLDRFVAPGMGGH